METGTDLEVRLRDYARQYDRDFPSTTGVERRIMARIAIAPSRPERASIRRWEWGTAGGLVRELAIVAALLLLAGVLVVGATRLRSLQTQTVTPPVTVTPRPGKPAQPSAYWSAVHFVSADVGWIVESKATVSGPTVVYRTADGGASWQQQLTWDGPSPAQVLFSADGSEGLVVGRGGVPIFRTADGGAHWQRTGLPSQVNQVDLQYFLDPHEGWIFSYLNQGTAGIAGVFHTIDGGQHWTQTASLDVNQVFSHGRVGGSLQGSLLFRDSSTGWITPVAEGGTNVPVVPPFMYITHDGGKTWAVQTVPVPAGVAMDSTTASFSPPEFFNDRDGVLLVTQLSRPSGPTAPAVEELYSYSTGDGGDHWSAPTAVVIPGDVLSLHPLAMIDARNWVTFNASQVKRTTDGGAHWEILAGGLPVDAYATVVDFQDLDHGWVAGFVTSPKPTVTMYRTEDGGAHWTAVMVPDVSGLAGGGQTGG
jgi:photosystem II stability/assembly factor-like uncharacterized protein